MADDDDIIWMADEDLEIEGENGVIYEDSDDDMGRSDEEKLSEAKMKEEEELAELESQFVTGGVSDETLKIGKHTKFCTSLAVGKDMLFKGGGDDQMLCFK